MEHKYNDQRIAEYSTRLARQLTDSYFLTNTNINGRELLTFSPIRQINLFILKDLLASWHQEFAKLQSPYFDYEAEEVTQSLAQFMNVLSQHILIKRQDFEPLLKRAITNAINWSTQPVATFEQVFLKSQDRVQVEELRGQLKYLDQDKAPMMEFLDNLHTNEAEPSFILSRLKLFVSSHYRDMSSADELFARLNQLLPLQANDLRDAPEPVKPSAPTSLAPAPAATVPSAASTAPSKPESIAPAAPATPVASPVSTPVTASSTSQPAEQPKPAPAAETPKPAVESAKPEPVKAEDKPKTAFTPPTPAVEKPASAPAPAPAPKPEPAPIVKSVQPEAPAPKQAPVVTTPPSSPSPAFQPQTATDKPLVERLRTERSSLNESLKPAETGSLAASHGASKIESLKNSISINQRFAFINELFGGDNQAYQNALSQLDQKPDLNSAKAFVENDLANQFNWKNKVDTVNKLLRLLERKFS